jgi:hypothetical protein
VVDFGVEGYLDVVGDVAVRPGGSISTSKYIYMRLRGFFLSKESYKAYILHPTMLGCCASCVNVSGVTKTLFVTPG